MPKLYIKYIACPLVLCNTPRPAESTECCTGARLIVLDGSLKAVLLCNESRTCDRGSTNQKTEVVAMCCLDRALSTQGVLTD
jgi:hypothetical protein